MKQSVNISFNIPVEVLQNDAKNNNTDVTVSMYHPHIFLKKQRPS